MEQIAQLTEEQRAVVDAVAHQHSNVIVNAVAGSGKTRTALSAALEFLSRDECMPQERALLVAYNKRLQQDMRAQLRDACAPASAKHRIEICTIHGFGHRYFGGSGLTTDRELCRWTGKCNPLVPFPDFRLVVIDEAQDLTPVLFSFLHYVLSRFANRPQLLILGDPFQLLYRFNGAVEDYLLDGASKFADVCADVPFIHLKLSVCFRITHEMATWINENLNPNNLNRAKEPYAGWFADRKERIADWWGQGIRANPARPPSPGSLIYLMRSALEYQVSSIVDKIVSVFERYDEENVALLSPSIVANEYSPVRRITNTLTTVNKTPQAWFFDKSRGAAEDMQTTSDLRKNKRIVSTIHKFKGRERNAIVLVGLDSFSEKVEKSDPMNVFNMFYVGATRARKHLLIIQWSDVAYATHCSRRTILQGIDDVCPPTCPVSSMLDYCPYDPLLCEESSSCLTAHNLAQVPPCPLSREEYIVPGTHCSDRYPTREDVSAIIGVGLEVKLQLLLDDGRLLLDDVSEQASKLPGSLVSFVRQVRKEAVTKRVYNWSEIMKIATALLTLNDRLFFRWRQVQDFHRWPVVTQSYKLDDNVKNLVHLLYLPLCEDEAQEGLSQVSAQVGFDEKLASLKALWRRKRFRSQVLATFRMDRNPEFVRKCAEEIVGRSMAKFNFEFNIKAWAELLKRAQMNKKAHVKGEGKDRDCKEKCDSDKINKLEDVDVTVITVKANSQTNHEHLLEVGCYGAMWRETFVEAFATTLAERVALRSEKERFKVKMLVVYPILGLVKQVELHMNSLEFLHRVGYRKLNKPFDAKVLEEEVCDCTQACGTVPNK